MSISRSGAADGSNAGVCVSVYQDPEAGAGVDRGGGAGLPLLDLGALRQLEKELGDPEIARSFARDYISIWDKRIRYLKRSILDNNPDAAMDAVLSIKNSALMVGGSRLAKLAVELEGRIRNGNLPALQHPLADVAEAGQATIQALQQCYLTPGK
jgi:HPt (histidine-containing phosphotransfer) domain-containing protein